MLPDKSLRTYTAARLNMCKKIVSIMPTELVVEVIF